MTQQMPIAPTTEVDETTTAEPTTVPPVENPVTNPEPAEPIPPQTPKRSIFSYDIADEPTDTTVPEWVMLPQGLLFPANKQVLFIRFRSEWTDAPGKGHPQKENEKVLLRPDGRGVQLWRQCIVWPINVADKRLALNRSLGDEDRALDELCRQMIRGIDGQRVDWGSAGIQDSFWNELGEKSRKMVRAIYHRLHNLGPEAVHDFLENCVAVRSSSY